MSASAPMALIRAGYKRATRIYESESLSSGDLGPSVSGSIPAASSNSTGRAATYVAAFSLAAPVRQFSPLGRGCVRSLSASASRNASWSLGLYRICSHCYWSCNIPFTLDIFGDRLRTLARWEDSLTAEEQARVRVDAALVDAG